MAVQLPNDLFVTGDFGGEVVELAPVLEWGTFSAQWFEVPIDRIAKTEVLESEQVEFSFTDAIGFFDQSLRGLGPA